MVVHTKKNYVKKLREKNLSHNNNFHRREKHTTYCTGDTPLRSQACHPFNADKEQEATYATVQTGNKPETRAPGLSPFQCRQGARGYVRNTVQTGNKPETRAPNSGSRAEGVCSQQNQSYRTNSVCCRLRAALSRHERGQLATTWPTSRSSFESSSRRDDLTSSHILSHRIIISSFLLLTDMSTPSEAKLAD